MTYEEWCENSKKTLADAEEYEQWRRKSQHILLTDIGPRIADLCKTGYMGCGFHYSMEQQFGKLIIALSMPWQPCANHRSKVKDAYINNIFNEVLFEGLLTQVEDAEKSREK